MIYDIIKTILLTHSSYVVNIGILGASGKWKGVESYKVEELIESDLHIDVDTILMYQIENLIMDYEKKLNHHLSQKDYPVCEKLLTDFCFLLADLPDPEQVFIARTFFISIITNMIRVQTRKEQLHPKTLSYAYKIIATIEKWENITEYILGTSTFINHIQHYISNNTYEFIHNIHVKKALQLIHFHLNKNHLTVSWLALQLDISTTHLASLFKLEMGETISKYITKKKVAEICFEIAHSSKSMTEIKETFGFSNNSYFIQYFKKEKGVTPLQYRRARMY